MGYVLWHLFQRRLLRHADRASSQPTGYQAAESEEDYLARLAPMTEAILAGGLVQGWGESGGVLRAARKLVADRTHRALMAPVVYTQLSDIETEQNGLLTKDRVSATHPFLCYAAD